MAKTSAAKPSTGLPPASPGLAWDNQGTYGYKEKKTDNGGYVYTNTIISQAKTNEPFDDRLYAGLPHIGGEIFRGYIANHQPVGPYRLRFMYNPNQINYGFELNTQLKAWDQTAGIPTAGVMGGHSISFDMYFNRQYEIAYKGDKKGVHRDLEVMKGLTGVEGNQGWMLMRSLKFCFAHDFFFYGYITAMQVQLGPFSKDMVPQMAVVSVAATWVPPVEDASTLKEGTEENLGGTTPEQTATKAAPAADSFTDSSSGYFGMGA